MAVLLELNVVTDVVPELDVCDVLVVADVVDVVVGVVLAVVVEADVVEDVASDPPVLNIKRHKNIMHAVICQLSDFILVCSARWFTFHQFDPMILFFLFELA